MSLFQQFDRLVGCVDDFEDLADLFDASGKYDAGIVSLSRCLLLLIRATHEARDHQECGDRGWPSPGTIVGR